jgi:hypothetical protein
MRFAQPRLAKVCLVAALAVSAGALADGAAAASSARSSSRAPASFCTVARGVARDIASSTQLSAVASASPADLRATYTRIAAAEPALLAAASGPLKVHARQVFAFLSVLIGDLRRAKWSFAAVAPRLKTLVPAANKAAPHLKAVERYLRTTCKLRGV